MIVNHELVKMVSSNTLFKGVSKSFLKSVIKPKNYFGVKEGTVIYTKGDDSTDLYLIVEGEVKIKFCEKNKVEQRFITDFFGEEELLNNDRRSSHAVANLDSILYAINSEELQGLIHMQNRIAKNLNKKNDESNPYGSPPDASDENSNSMIDDSTNEDLLSEKDDFNVDGNSENIKPEDDLGSLSRREDNDTYREFPY